MHFRSVLVATIVSLFVFSSVASTRAATPQQVEAAITKGRAYLNSKFKDNICWEEVPARLPSGEKGPSVNTHQFGGLTALATYALLAAGESAQSPHIVKAVEFLRTTDMIGIYALGLRAQVWLNIPKNDQIRLAIEKDTKLLLHARATQGVNKGLYGYFDSGNPTAGGDHSTSQYGVLGIWACSDAVEGIPDSFWQDVSTTWRKDQGPDGSWAYRGKPGEIGPPDKEGKTAPIVGKPSMTAAGVATLFICQDFLNRDKGLNCSGNIVDKDIDQGLKWMADHYTQAEAAGGYTLYGIERIGVASGYKYFGDVDWYQRGADYVVKKQAADGSFPVGVVGPIDGTSFALLFLSRGRAPVMMNKLDYSTGGKEANWNERPRDAFNIAHWVGKQTEHNLNWQITNLKVPETDWHDAPILYMSGNQALSLGDEEKKKLKAFVEEGGMILGNADCGKKEFADSFRKLGTELFKSYEFENVPVTATILHDEQFLASKWKKKPTLMGLNNGVRELMLLIPDADPAKAWQMQEAAGKEELFQLMANIFLYAVDKNNLANKGETYMVEPDPRVKATATIDVARMSFDGNWNPEPGGWRRLSAVMHNDDSLDVTTEVVDPSKPGALAGKKIAHMTGTSPCKLSPAAVDGIKQFIAAGGTLVVDAAGGDSRFAQSLDSTFQAIFGADADQLREPLPPDNALYTTGGKLEEVGYRNFARATLGSLKTPRLRGITQAGRLVCVFSPEDLSAGLVGQPVDGIIGYDPATATALMRKILLLASGAKPVKPTPAPAPAKAATPAKGAAPAAKPATKAAVPPAKKP